jgi:hypothetical protein
MPRGAAVRTLTVAGTHLACFGWRRAAGAKMFQNLPGPITVFAVLIAEPRLPLPVSVWVGLSVVCLAAIGLAVRNARKP